MGGMQTWIWAQKYPDFMDAAVPMASLPTEMSGATDDAPPDHRFHPQRPEWMNGNYTKQHAACSSRRCSTASPPVWESGALQGDATREKADSSSTSA